MAESRAKQQAKAADQGPADPAVTGPAVPEVDVAELARDVRMAVEALEGLAGRVVALEGGIAQVGEQTREGLASMMEQISARLQALAPVPGAQEDGPTGDQLAAMAAEVGWLRGCVRLLGQAIGVRLPPSPDRSAVVDAREADAALVVHAGGEGGTVGPGVVFGSG